MLPATRSLCSFSRPGSDAPVFARPPVSSAAEPRSSAPSFTSDREPVRNLKLGCRPQLSQACSGPVLRPLQRSTVHCSAQKRDPPDAPKEETQRRGGREWLQTLLSRFGPLTDKAPNRLVLDFEKPLVELDNRIKEVDPLFMAVLQFGEGFWSSSASGVGRMACDKACCCGSMTTTYLISFAHQT